ncbi:hypothetical protein ACHAWO_004076 [Cyclotella atomus]|uniref:Methyltransferase type 11 domain-containing protein n=1 Tax=Cyclotella atomus TaxID=382360 RepID=A0ABD3Q1A3_9STRA
MIFKFQQFVFNALLAGVSPHYVHDTHGMRVVEKVGGGNSRLRYDKAGKMPRTHGVRSTRKLSQMLLLGGAFVIVIQGIFIVLIVNFYTSSFGSGGSVGGGGAPVSSQELKGLNESFGLESSHDASFEDWPGLKGSSKEAYRGKEQGDHDAVDDGGHVGSPSAQVTPTQNAVDEARKKTQEKWDNAQQTFAEGGAWHQHPLVTKTYAERLGAGSEDRISHLIDNYGEGKTCISIGCGDGGIEVELVRRGFCATLKGIDLSPVRVANSNAKVPEDLKDRMEFRVEDAEKNRVQESFDVVLFNHALHHISNLEGISEAIRDHLMNPDGGILVLEEYVGPVRWQFPPEHVAEIVRLLKDLERDHPNYIPIFRQNPLWDGDTFQLPDPVSVEKDDPSETVRSNEIVPVLSNYFKIVEDVPTGGNFFQWIFHNAYNALKTEEGNQIVQKMLDREMEVIRSGVVKSDYVFQVWKHQNHDAVDDGGHVGSPAAQVTPTQNAVDEARKKTQEKWDNAQQTFAEGGAWHQHPLVTKTYAERLGAGSGDRISHLIDNYGEGKTCISIGCGDGGIEVELVRRGFCATLKGIDLSPVRVANSNAKVPEDLKDRMEFRVEDAEKNRVQESFDVVLFNHALHHISNLEGISEAIRDHLMNPDGGILVLEEYVGPVRWQFPPEHVAEIVRLLKDLERDHPNYIPIFRQNPLWDGDTFQLPDPVSVEKDDPSETVRSNEIVPVLSNYFKIVEDVPTGGNFFQWIFHNAYNALKTEEGNQIVQKMLDREMEVIRSGVVKSDYVFQVWKHQNHDAVDDGGHVGSPAAQVTPTQNAVDEARKKTQEKWDNAQQTFAEGGAWHQHPLVTKTYAERLGAGSGDRISHLIDNYGGGKTCISIGCGDGGIEVELVRSGFCATLKGIDLSPVRVANSNARVPVDLKDRMEFRVEDAEKNRVQESFDVVLFTHALHHISNLEGMSEAIRDHLMNPDGGILVLEEYVGPVRWQFPPEHVAEIVRLLKDLERDHPNYIPIFRQNPLWDGDTFQLPDPVSVEKDDPSETVRSNEIVPVLSNYFKIVEDVPTGGNFFQWIFHNAYNALKTEEGNQIVQKMLDREMEVIRSGVVKSDYVFQVWKHQNHDEGDVLNE